MLGVGIHENVVLTGKTTINDKKCLVVGFSTKIDESAFMAAMERGENVSTDEANIMMFPPKTTDWENKPLTWLQSADAMTKFRMNLIDILAIFVPIDQAKAALSLQVQISGLNITQANMSSKFLEETVLLACFDNISRAFVAASAPFQDKGTFRIKLSRSSKKSHFPTIPKRGDIPEVWIESMQVPKAASKVAWTAYDIKQGYNDGTPMATDSTGTAQAEAAFASPSAPVFAAATAPAFPAFTQTPVGPAPTIQAPIIAPAINVFDPANPAG
jgi:hypothetical protein